MPGLRPFCTCHDGPATCVMHAPALLPRALGDVRHEMMRRIADLPRELEDCPMDGRRALAMKLLHLAGRVLVEQTPDMMITVTVDEIDHCIEERHSVPRWGDSMMMSRSRRP